MEKKYLRYMSEKKGVKIPAELLRKLNIDHGDAVEIEEKDGCIVMKKHKKKAVTEIESATVKGIT